MTTINDISDLIRILRDDPAWADAVRSVLLSQELLRLPEEVIGLTRALREHVETTNRRLESLEKEVAALTKALREHAETTNRRLESLEKEVAALTRALREHVETTNRRLESLEAGQDELKQGQDELKQGQDELKQGQQLLSERQDRLEQGQAQLQATVNGMQTTVNGMRGELGNLSGSFFQRRAANFAERIARRDFHLRPTSLLHHADQVGDSTLKQMLNDAAEDASRDFTEDDAALVEQADAVIAGRAPDGTEVYLLVEMSITIVKDDVDRAKDRAELLERAVGARSHALVIGEAIAEDAATQAKHRAVAFAAFTPRRSPAQDLRASQEN